MKEDIRYKKNMLAKSVVRAFKIAMLFLLMTSVFPFVLFFILTASAGTIAIFLIAIGVFSLNMIFIGSLFGILLFTYINFNKPVASKGMKCLIVIVGLLAFSAGAVTMLTHKTDSIIYGVSSRIFVITLIAVVVINAGVKKIEKKVIPQSNQSSIGT